MKNNFTFVKKNKKNLKKVIFLLPKSKKKSIFVIDIHKQKEYSSWQQKPLSKKQPLRRPLQKKQQKKQLLKKPLIKKLLKNNVTLLTSLQPKGWRLFFYLVGGSFFYLILIFCGK